MLSASLDASVRVWLITAPALAATHDESSVDGGAADGGAADGESSTADGAGLVWGSANRPCKFVVVARDAAGNAKRHGGDDVKAVLRGQAGVLLTRCSSATRLLTRV